MNNISPAEALEILLTAQNAVLVDVRTPIEWEGGVPAITNLELITISSDIQEFKDSLQNKLLSLDSTLLFICKGGVRSASAAQIAKELGYKDCYNISGGFVEWQNSNLPSEKRRMK